MNVVYEGVIWEGKLSRNRILSTSTYNGVSLSHLQSEGPFFLRGSPLATQRQNIVHGHAFENTMSYLTQFLGTSFYSTIKEPLRKLSSSFQENGSSELVGNPM